MLLNHQKNSNHLNDGYEKKSVNLSLTASIGTSKNNLNQKSKITKISFGPLVFVLLVLKFVVELRQFSSQIKHKNILHRLKVFIESLYLPPVKLSPPVNHIDSNTESIYQTYL